MTITIVDHQIPDLTHDLYDVTFFEEDIQALVTETPQCVDGWISDLESLHRLHIRRCRVQNRPPPRLIVGLDVEWRPNQNRYSQNPVAILQLCVAPYCLIYKILHSPFIPQSLINFLENPNYTFVGVGIKNDVDKLWEDYNLVVQNTEDLRELAAEMYNERELRNAGLTRLARRVLGKEVNKPHEVRTSRWDYMWLSPAQVQYACIDAFLSYEIGKNLI